jgi:hypothetical protein
MSAPWLAIYDDRVYVQEPTGQVLCEITGSDSMASILVAERIANTLNRNVELVTTLREIRESLIGGLPVATIIYGIDAAIARAAA